MSTPARNYISERSERITRTLPKACIEPFGIIFPKIQYRDVVGDVLFALHEYHRDVTDAQDQCKVLANDTAVISSMEAIAVREGAYFAICDYTGKNEYTIWFRPYKGVTPIVKKFYIRTEP